MDSGLEERRLPSIRRSQLVLIYRNGGVANPETCGQIACAVRRLPIRFTVGTGGTIIEFHGGHRRHDQDESTGDTVSFL